MIPSHWQPLFSKKMAAADSFSYKIGGGGLIFLQNLKISGGGLIFLQNWPHYWRLFWHGLDIGLECYAYEETTVRRDEALAKTRNGGTTHGTAERHAELKNPGLIVWQSSYQPNWTRQNFSPTKELIPIYLLKEPYISHQLREICY